MALNDLIESIQKAFKVRDNKEKELHDLKLNLIESIDVINKKIDSLSYKALIEEDEAAIKEYEALKVELDQKRKELKLTEEKIKALDKFEVGIDTRKKAVEAYKSIQKEIDKNSKEIGKLTTDYYKAKAELVKVAKGIIELYKETNLLPLEIKDVLDLIDPEDIGKTEEELRNYKENLRLREHMHYLDLFEDNRLKYLDNKVSWNDINQILNGDIRINPYIAK